MIDINNPPVSPLWARVLGLVLCFGGFLTAWILFGELRTPSASRASPWVHYPLLGLLAIIIGIAVVQGTRMVFARRPEAMRLPTPVLWFGAALLFGSAGLQTFFLIKEPDFGDPWQILLGIGGALGAVQLIRRRSRGAGKESKPPDEVG